MRRLVAFVVLSLSALSYSVHAQSKDAVAHSARITAGVDTNVKTLLKQVVPAYAKADASLPSEAMAADAEISDMVLLLKRAPGVQAAFEQLLKEQLDPASPHYHQWLQPQQVGDLYGPAQSDIDAVTAWLQSQGLTVTGVDPSKISINFKGSADVVAHAFSTSLRSYHLANGETRYSVAEAPSIPAAIATVVETVHGLSQTIFYSQAREGDFVAAPKSNISSSSNSTTLKPNYTSSSSGRHYMVAGDFAVAYNLNSVYSSGYKGAGQRIAIAGRSRTEDSDISVLQTLQGQTVKQPTIIVASGGTDPGKTQTNDQVEATLDVNRVSGTAPDAGIDLVIATSLQTAISYAVYTVNDPILSISFGGCEYLNGPSVVGYYDNLFQVASSQGISVFVSSGDDGVAACNAFYTAIPAVQRVSINEICATGWATCIGGTEFVDTTSSLYWNSTNASNGVSIRSYIPEGAWNDVTLGTSGTYTSGATGGGHSNYVYQPAWQFGLEATPSSAYRWIPDMSFNGSPIGGFVTFLSYRSTTGFYGYGGTSVAAPSMAAVQALMNQKLGDRQGNINARLYGLGLTPSASVYHDTTPATTGLTSCTTVPSLCNNSTPGSSSLTGGLAGYMVAEGWDAATGWGSMNVANYLASSSLKPSSIRSTLSSSTIQVGQTTSVNVTVTSTSGTPTGTVRVTVNGSSTTATLSSGIATLTTPVVTTGGTYSVSVAYLGSTEYLGSSFGNSLTVSSLPLTTTNLSLASTTITSTDSNVLTATVTSGTAGTIAGAVNFFDGSNFLGSGTLASGVAMYTIAAGRLTIGTHTITAIYNGSASFNASSSLAKTLIVNGLASTVTLTPATSTITAQQAVTFTATVTGSGATPTGSVDLVENSSVLATASLSSGTATFSGRLFTVGTHTIKANYNGSTTYAGSTSNNSVITTTAIPSTTTLSANASAINQTQPLTLTAIVAGAGGTPAGTVQFLDGVAVVGTSTLSSGTATYTITVGTLTSGAHSFTAKYIGGDTYAASSSAASTVAVTIVSFSLATSSNTLTLAVGASTGNTATISATGVNGFSNTAQIDLGCSIVTSVASAPTCTINPSSITTASTAVVTVSTTAAHTASSVAKNTSRQNMMVLCGLLLLGVPLFSRRRFVQSGLLAIVFAAGLVCMSGCGGGASSAPSNSIPRTPAGTYTVTITGASSGVATQSTTITVTVN